MNWAKSFDLDIRSQRISIWLINPRYSTLGFLPTSCCFKFTKNRLSLKQVKSYYITSSFCPHPAVVFTTRKGFKICARSSEKWVTDLIIQLPAN
ncbi:hypothetical protein XELAEV_18015360mg [Xenopus laevis]|uniref:C-C motif chemokine n=1 Tax=Xenopus laevis TaxID=8355 RepID=A0A974DHU6_XENLA|nr:hypothetical protein XELAEV_18015360mg [Xenopus laevis]